MSKNIGGCRLEKVQSASEHSELYRAFSEELQRPVMVKVLAVRYPATSKTGRRFVRGGKLATELEHPNIVRTFSSGDDGGRPYMLMEFVDGHSLDRVLKVKPSLPWELATGIVRQVAKALDRASESDIVHRAIEPSHIMLSQGGRTRVLGFGLARHSSPEDAGITAEGSLIKVSAYSPPEVGGGIQDVRGDIYSLGCVFYHLLTGKPPFESGDSFEMLHMHRTTDPWPVSDLVSDIPEAIEELLAGMLNRELNERIQKPSDLIAMVDAAVNPEVLGEHGIKPDRTIVASTMEMLALRNSYTVLVCEDQESTLHSIRETLRLFGLNVIATRDGQAAVEALTDKEVMVVITDLRVPSLYGEELIEAMLRARKGVSIILTRTGSEAEKIYEKGVYPIRACLGRPLDLFALRRTVQEALA